MGETFVINDRRGQKKEPRQDAPVIITMDDGKDKSSWAEVAYMMDFAQVPGPGGQPQVITIGRAVGIRSDERVFIGEYALSRVWKEGYDWTPHAKRRLDTYLGCLCSETGPCATHKEYMVKWGRADQDRLEAIAYAAVPKPIEFLMRAEMARQQARIVVPGGVR